MFPSRVISFSKSSWGNTTESQCFKVLGVGPEHLYCLWDLSDSRTARMENCCVSQTMFLDSKFGIVFWDSGSPLKLSPKPHERNGSLCQTRILQIHRDSHQWWLAGQGWQWLVSLCLCLLALCAGLLWKGHREAPVEAASSQKRWYVRRAALVKSGEWDPSSVDFARQ